MRDKKSLNNLSHAKATFGLSIAGIVITILLLIFIISIFGIVISYGTSSHKHYYGYYDYENILKERHATSKELDEYLYKLIGLGIFAGILGFALFVVTIITIVFAILMYRKSKSNLATVSWILLILALVLNFIIIILAIIGYALAIKSSSDIIKKSKEKEPYFYYDENPTAVDRQRMKEESFSTRWTD